MSAGSLTAEASMLSEVSPTKLASKAPANEVEKVLTKPLAQALATIDAPPQYIVSPEVKRRARNELILKILAPILGLCLMLLIWEGISKGGQTIPGPLATGKAAITVLSNPFYQNGPNDQGIGFKVMNSLGRVGLGFGLAALVGIPLGFLIGRFSFLNGMVSPIISLLRPVSPLAWLPIGLLVFKGAHPAAIWTIFISSIWPMVINTAVGVQRVPADYMNVAKVLNIEIYALPNNSFIPIFCGTS